MTRTLRKSSFRFMLWSIVGIFLASGQFIRAGTPWEQVYKLLAADGAEFNDFGRSVAISGDTVVIGTPGGVGNVAGSGCAYVFDITTGSQLLKLLATDGADGDLFGISVAVSGNYAVIGAEGDDVNGYLAGSAYIFNITTGEQLYKLLPTDGGDTGDLFGESVAISGTQAIIGAEGDDNGFGDSGSAYVFDVTTGTLLSKLVAADPAPLDKFGRSVAISGGTALVGKATGAAYVFNAATGEQLFKLLASDGGFTGDDFGGAVALSGHVAVVGSWSHEDNGWQSGSAYVFDTTTGLQLFELLPSDGGYGDQFGYSVAVSGDLAVIGALGSSRAYIFNVTTGEQLFEQYSFDDYYKYFASAVAISGDTVVVGAFLDSQIGYSAGAAYVYQPQTTNLLAVSPDPLISGQDGTFSITKTIPTEKTWLLYSLKGVGSTYISQLKVSIYLRAPKIAVGPKLTDSNGDLILVLPIPNVSTTTNVWFQAVQKQNATNFVATRVVP